MVLLNNPVCFKHTHKRKKIVMQQGSHDGSFYAFVHLETNTNICLAVSSGFRWVMSAQQIQAWFEMHCNSDLYTFLHTIFLLWPFGVSTMEHVFVCEWM